MFSTVQRGSSNQDDFRVYFKDGNGVYISPMHDIPLFADEANSVFNMVVEVPRWTNAKMEISLKDDLNPIKQDVKKGKLRYVANVFPHKGYIWNYGAIPQTFEDPEHIDPSTNCKGDSDPIDVCEIGQKVHERGSVVQVKVLGTVALIDEGETDWKVLAIDVNDPLAAELNDVNDIEKHMPGFLAATVEWFRVYKMPDGKPANDFAFNGEPKDRAFATDIVMQCHGQWKKLMERADEFPGISRKCTTVECSSKTAAEEAEQVVSAAAEVGAAGDRPGDVDKWHYVKL